MLQCKVCEVKDLFLTLLDNDVEQDKAFHIAVSVLLEDVIEDTVERSYEAGKVIGLKEGLEQGLEQGYENGYKEASCDLAEIVGSYANSVLEG